MSGTAVADCNEESWLCTDGSSGGCPAGGWDDCRIEESVWLRSSSCWVGSGSWGGCGGGAGCSAEGVMVWGRVGVAGLVEEEEEEVSSWAI